ncbi:MAG: hypothetical protein KC613_00465 [Myxococcales bacterium]|nr:hypothetical protein [Myxococcales bacterium]MCB9526228.1 hypothetical protein [Myxococcales bacterium]
MSSPLQTVKSVHGDKAQLVEKLLPLMDRLPEETEDAFKERVQRISNAKLLRLWTRFEAVKRDFGTREALVDKIVELEKADGDRRRKLLDLPTGRLLDLHGSLARRA